MPRASRGLGRPACAGGGRGGPAGRLGVGRVHAALLFLLSFRRLPVENVILSLEALALGSAAARARSAAHLCYARRCWPAAEGLRAGGLL